MSSEIYKRNFSLESADVICAGGLRVSGHYKKTCKDKPLISVITVVYNAKEHVEKTILSVLGQTYDNVEYIIVDGASTDGTIDIIKKYKNELDYYISSLDEGVYDAMNRGVELATGLWLNFLNAGDRYVDDHVLSSVVDSLNHEKDANYGVVAGGYILEKAGSKHLPQRNRNVVMSGGILTCHQAMFFNKDLLREDIFYDIRYKICADNDMMMRIIKGGIPIKYIDKEICYFQDGGISSRVELVNKKRKEKYLSIFRNFGLFGVIRAFLYNKIINSHAT